MAKFKRKSNSLSSKRGFKRGLGFDVNKSPPKARKSLKSSGKGRSFDLEQYTKDWDFYNLLWESREQKMCDVCGEGLYGDNKNYYHDHLIEKSTNNELRYEVWNMALVCLDCHSLKTNGHPKDKHKELIKRAQEFYKQFKNKNEDE